MEIVRTKSDLENTIRALARARRGHPAPHLVSTLIEQCKNFEANPNGMRPRILRTIEMIGSHQQSAAFTSGEVTPAPRELQQ